MLNVAITGGIGSGKTQASDYLRSLGYTVIDADAVSRSLTAPGGKALPLIRERFGDDLFNDDGSLNRSAVREIIFNDPVKKSLYESCTTRLVLHELERIRKNNERAGEGVMFYDIPLLYETGTEKDYDQVWVVTADDDIRKRRVMERSNLDEATICLIMRGQTTEEEKIEKADRVIYNNGTIGDMHEAINAALKNFLK